VESGAGGYVGEGEGEEGVETGRDGKKKIAIYPRIALTRLRPQRHRGWGPDFLRFANVASDFATDSPRPQRFSSRSPSLKRWASRERRVDSEEAMACLRSVFLGSRPWTTPSARKPTTGKRSTSHAGEGTRRDQEEIGNERRRHADGAKGRAPSCGDTSMRSVCKCSRIAGNHPRRVSHSNCRGKPGQLCLTFGLQAKSGRPAARVVKSDGPPRPQEAIRPSSWR